jgi:hypothetical protein
LSYFSSPLVAVFFQVCVLTLLSCNLILKFSDLHLLLNLILKISDLSLLLLRLILGSSSCEPIRQSDQCPTNCLMQEASIQLQKCAPAAQIVAQSVDVERLNGCEPTDPCALKQWAQNVGSRSYSACQAGGREWCPFRPDRLPHSWRRSSDLMTFDSVRLAPLPWQAETNWATESRWNVALMTMSLGPEPITGSSRYPRHFGANKRGENEIASLSWAEMKTASSRRCEDDDMCQKDFEVRAMAFDL